MPLPTKKPAARVYPKGKSGAVSGRVKKPVRTTPRTTAKALPNKQRPVKTPMSLPDRAGRANKAKGMSRRGAKGPVQYKHGGGNSKKR